MPQGWEEWPVIAITCSVARAYCEWLTDRMSGGDDASANPALEDAAARRFSLPDEDEWEKAAWGPDGRSYPWDDEFDSSFCSTVGSRPGERETRNPEPFGLFPMDESPYGIRDMAGGAQAYTTGKTGVGGRWNIIKGGAWGAGPPLCRAASRMYSDPVDIHGTHGIRLFARRAPR